MSIRILLNEAISLGINVEQYEEKYKHQELIEINEIVNILIIPSYVDSLTTEAL